MKKIICLFIVLIGTMSMHVHAQTNPTAVSLPFTLNSQSVATLPAGVAVHRFSSIQTTRTLSAANGGDLPNQGSSASGTAGGWYHLSADGIGLLASASNPAGAVVVAINTTGLSNISVSWICKTIKNQSSRDNSVALQYRVGTTGSFINVGSSSTYSSTGNADGHSSSTFTETLPVGAENQPVVQVRWIYWESVSTGGSRDKISVKNISISGSTSGCSSPASVSVSSITNASATISWPSVSGAVSYEYQVSTSATPPSSGSSTGSTSVAASGLSAATTYYAHVRSNCGSTFSSWVSNSFNTLSNDTSSSSAIVLATYNLLNYPGSSPSTREPSYRIIMNEINPDILVVQELSQSSGVSSFLNNVLNYSSTTYSAGTFNDGPDSDNGIFYKTAKFQFISNTPISTPLRDINEFRLKDNVNGDTLIIYSVHLKASNTTADEAQRAQEVDSLRKRTDALAAGKYFVVCGDFNIYGSSESAYQNLLQNGNNVNGKFNDVLSMTGVWNNSAYAIHHTQSPRTTSFGGGATGGLDDRFDMILFSNAISQAGGYDVVSSTYKAFGNDGQHYNAALNTAPFGMYTQTVATAVHDASDHLPVIVELSWSGPLRQSHTGKQGEAIVEETGRTQSQLGTNILQPEMEEMLSIYPNPATKQFYVKLNKSLAAPAQMDMYDANGKLVYTFSIGQQGTYTIDLSALQLGKGIYYLKSAQFSGQYKTAVY